MAAYEHAYLWQKGRDERENFYTLAEESVMTGAGPVFFGVICDSDYRTKKTVGWFYDEVLPILRERGLGIFVRNSFLRHFSGRNEQFNCGVVIVFKRKLFFALRGNLEFVRISRRGKVRGIIGRKANEGFFCNSADRRNRNCGFVKLHRREKLLLWNSDLASCFNDSELGAAFSEKANSKRMNSKRYNTAFQSIFTKKTKQTVSCEDKLKMLGRRAVGRGCTGSLAAILFWDKRHSDNCEEA